MKKISILLVALLSISSCGDDIDKSKPAAPQVYPVYKNEYRVSSIEGKNQRWGEFKIKMYYNSAEKLDSAWITNKDNRRIGSIIGKTSVSSASKSTVTYIYDYIPIISADSIERMDDALEAKYGAGNYSLIDSIPVGGRSIRAQTTSFYSDGRKASAKIENYVPRQYLGTSGVDFNNSYLKNNELRERYEYNNDGRITVLRTLFDNYEVDFEKNTSNIKNNEVYKQVMSYNGSRVERIEDFILISGENFSLVNDYQFSYSNAGITSINYGGKTRTFTRSGDKLTITEGTSIKTYTLDGSGYPIHIEDESGNFMKISYERGHGDFEILTSEMEKAQGYPYIR